MDTVQKVLGKALRVAALVTAVSAGSAAPGMGQAKTTVTVENARDVPVVVYLERGRFDTRLGMVGARATGILPLPSWLENGEKIRFTVHPEGEFDLTTEDQHKVSSGHSIDLYVPRNDVGFVASETPAAPTIANPDVDAATVTVDNPRNEPVVVFLENGDFDTRIGTVDAHSEDTFSLPKALTQDRPTVDIFVHVEGGMDLHSETFAIAPRAHLMVKVNA